jgi:PTS system cellobiose-specific IIC component
MEQYLKIIEKALMPPLTKLSEQKHLRAVRDGIVSVLPMIITGSIFLLLGQLPIDFIKEPAYSGRIVDIVKFYQETLSPNILIPYRLTMGLMALYASFAIAFSLSQTYEMDSLSTGILSAASFLLTILPQKILLTGGDKPEWIIPIDKLGGKGLFVAIFCAFITVEVTRFLMSKKLFFSMPEGVPPAVTRAFSSLVPGIVVLSLIWGLRMIVDIHALISWILNPLVRTGDGLVAIILINLLIQLIWVTGIHGTSVVNAVALPFWLSYLEDNSAAHAAGNLLPHITSLPFYQWFIWIGGSGATLSLVLMMLFSKSSHLKNLSRIAILPSIFNINEPVIFGLPVVMNPVIAVPFVIAPVVSGTIAFIAVKSGLVQAPYILAPWTLPVFLGALFSTGFDWKAVILVLVNMIVTGLIYYPFFKIMENKALENEGKGDA